MTKEQIIKAYQNTGTLEQAAGVLNVPVSTLHYQMVQNKIERRPRGRRVGSLDKKNKQYGILSLWLKNQGVRFGRLEMLQYPKTRQALNRIELLTVKYYANEITEENAKKAAHYLGLDWEMIIS